MKVVSIAGLVVVLVVLLSLVMAAAGRVQLTVERGVEYVVALLLLDAAQDADERGDEVLSAVASLAAVFTAFLPLL